MDLSRFLPLPALLLLLLLLISGRSSAQTDEECLSLFRQSVTDPQGALATWDNSSNICSAIGVQCLHPSEVKVYSLSLSQEGLSGPFPGGLDKCTSLTGLDLSRNQFSGLIPANICTMLPYLVTLDLSNNRFSGPIPPELGQCAYLNKLDLRMNELSGDVPGQLGSLPRLKDLDLSGNRLTGEIPVSLQNMAREGFSNNKGLCGPPVSKDCSGGSGSTGLIAGTVVAGAVVLLVAALVIVYMRRAPRGKTRRDDGTWAKRIKTPRNITVSMFGQFLVKIRMSDLMAATENFSKESVIDSAPTGVSYKATLRDGSVLSVKRLPASVASSGRGEAQFRAEMEALGHVRHANLVPLLGYCIAGPERLLVYKHMSNGSLWNWLFEAHAGERLEWPARLKIALGTARGLAYLHHSCNPRILHRDLSPRTILLDDDFEARITGFGLVRLLTPVNGQVNAEVVGEFGEAGHVAPEYSRVPITTSKGDVFSFGVVLLELLTSQKAVDLSVGDFKGSLVEWIGSLYGNGRSSEALDKSLMGRGADEELLQALKVACGCVLFLPKDRPSMYEVFQQLRKVGEKYDFTDQDDDIVIAANAAEVPGSAAAAASTAGHGNGSARA